MYEKLFKIQNMKLKFEKNGKNPFFKSDYLTLDGLWSVLQPVLEEEGLMVYHYSKDKEVCTVVRDKEDGKITSCMPLPENLDPQKLGSAVTYYKRYNLGQIFNIMTDADDDGNNAKPTVKKPTDATSKDGVDDLLD